MRTSFVLPRLFATCVLTSAALGCGSSDPEPEGAGGSGPGPVTLDCAVTVGDGAPLQLGEGARTRLPVTVGADVGSVVVVSAAAGLRAALSPTGDELVLEAAYGTGGQTLPVALEASCGDAAAPLEVVTTVRGIDFAPVLEWSSADAGPPGREYGTMWIDAEDPDRLLVFGGFHYQPEQFTPSADLWEYDLAGNAWTELTPTGAVPMMPGGRMVDIPGERAAYYYGGLSTETEAGGTPYSLLRFDYAPEALAFSDVDVTQDKASGDYLPAMIYDAPRNRYVTACGASDTLGYHCKVNAFHPDTGAWEALTPAGDEKPKGRNGFFWVHDVENDRLVMFSGEMGSGGWECNCAEDTWALELAEEPVRWVKLAGPQTPPLGRRNGAYAYDPVGHRMFIWGGTPDGSDTFPGVYAFDLDRGEEGWAKVETAFVPPERTSGMAVYDAARGRVLFGFGNGTGGVHTDLWALQL
jgi:hypothetical protein